MRIKRLWDFKNEWFLFLFTLFIVFNCLARYPESIPLSDLLFYFVKCLIWSVLLVVLFRLILPFRKAALYTLLLLMINALYGVITEFIAGIADLEKLRFRYVLPVIILFSATIFYYLRKSAPPSDTLVRSLNVLFILLISISLVQFFLQIQKARNFETTIIQNSGPVDKPDIFLIVTDGYAGDQQLKQLFNFDNTQFLDSLKQLGFFVAANSQSNYSGTSSSMATLLNMGYAEISNNNDVNLLFDKAPIIKTFQQVGYSIINNSIFKIGGQFPHQPTTYFPTGIKLITKHHLVYSLQQVFHNTLYSFNIPYEVNRINKIKHDQKQANYQRDSITSSRLMTLLHRKSQAPLFSYSHFIMPHAPYLFNKDGSINNNSKDTNQDYLNYLQYTNRKLLQIVESIINARPGSVVILLSDHGYRNDNDKQPTPFRFSNLMAIYYPDKKYQYLYHNLSNVNVFRVILNDRFKQSYKLLPDSTYY